MAKRLTIVVIVLSASSLFFSCDKKGTEPDPAPKANYQYPMYVLAYDNILDKNKIYKISVPNEIVLDSADLEISAYSMHLTPDERHLILVAGWWQGTQSWLVSMEDYSVVATADWRGLIHFDRSRNIGLRLWIDGVYTFDPNTLSITDSFMISNPEISLDTVSGYAFVTSYEAEHNSKIYVLDYLNMSVIDTLYVPEASVIMGMLFYDYFYRDLYFLGRETNNYSIYSYGLDEDSILFEKQNAGWVLPPVARPETSDLYTTVTRHMGFEPFDIVSVILVLDRPSLALIDTFTVKSSDTTSRATAISDIASLKDGSLLYLGGGGSGYNSPLLLRLNPDNAEIIDITNLIGGLHSVAVEIGSSPQ